MGNCCSVPSTVLSSSLPPGPVARSVPALAPSQPEAEDDPSPQPRNRTKSMPQPKLHSGESSRGSNQRGRLASEPQPPLELQSRNRFDCRTSDPERPNVEVDRPTVSCSTPSRSLSSVTPLTGKQRKALQVSRGKTIRASIEAGRNGYWCNLWSKVDFIDKSLKSCVGIIHTGIVDVWNLNDTDRYLSSDRFKISMSHVVKDLDAPARGASRGPDNFANWVYAAYDGRRQEVVQCLMGYIVDLHVILDGIMKTAICNVTDSDVLEVINEHVRSGRRDSIHRDIRNFVTETFRTRFAISQRDLFLEKIIDLIRQYCDDLPSGYI